MNGPRALQSASRSITLALHMLDNTHNIVKDAKLLLNVLNHVLTAYDHALRAMLISQGIAHSDDFMKNLNMVRVKCAKKTGIDVQMLIHAEHAHQIHEAHKASPVEFSKKDKFVICDEDYGTTVLSVDGLREQIEHAKVFIEKAASLVFHAP